MNQSCSVAYFLSLYEFYNDISQNVTAIFQSPGTTRRRTGEEGGEGGGGGGRG